MKYLCIEEMAKQSLPSSYTQNLSKSDKKKQIKNLKESRRAYKIGHYISRPKLKSFKGKRSSYTVKIKEKFPQAKTLEDLAKATGIPLRALKAVKKKGMGAYYSSGSRPNQTAHSWAMGRVYSYILGGRTRKIDKHITEKFNVKFMY